MEKALLLAELRALANDAPDFGKYTVSSPIHHEWLGKFRALVKQWDPGREPSISQSVSRLNSPLMREVAISEVNGTLYQAIADIEINLPGKSTRAFGPGAVYDFFKALSDLLASATRSILSLIPISTMKFLTCT